MAENIQNATSLWMRSSTFRSENAKLPRFEHIAGLLRAYKLDRYVDLGRQSPLTGYLLHSIATNFNQSVLPYITALLPRATTRRIMSQESGDSAAEHRYSVAQIHILVYAATNKMVGSKQQISFNMLCEYLREPVCAILEEASYRSLNQLADDRQAWKSMAETIFRSTIESGDHATAAKLLALPQLDIDVNESIPGPGQRRLTPVQRSSQLNHVEMVELLLHYGADVNKTCERQDNNYTLDYAIREHPDDLPYCNLHLVDLLLRFGAQIGCMSRLQCAISEENTDVIRSLVKAFLPREKQRWVLGGIFHIILERLNEQDIIWILETASFTAFDVNIKLHCLSKSCRCGEAMCKRDSKTDRKGIITVAAERGHLLVVNHLLEAGLVPTQCTLVGAIRSRSIDMCKLLLNRGVDHFSFSDHFHTTPVAEAFRIEENEILNMLRPLSFLEKVVCRASCCAVLQALVEIRDAETLETFLLTDPAKLLHFRCCTRAISQAAERDFTELAIFLLGRLPWANRRSDSGKCACHYAAPTRRLRDGEYMDDPLPIALRRRNDGEYMDDPLLIALRRRNNTLIRALIDPLNDMSFISPSARKAQGARMLAAATHGNAMVLEWLHRQGCPFDRSLAATVKFGNLDCMRLLLNLGAASEPLPLESETALQEAIKQNDEVAFRELLEHGQDPKDSRAMTLAVKLSSPLFEPLLDAAQQSVPSFQIWPLDLRFALTGLASAIVWDKKYYVRRLLEFGVRIDICKVHLTFRMGHDLGTEPSAYFDALYRFDYQSNTFDEIDMPEVPWLPVQKKGSYAFSLDLYGMLSPLGLAVIKDRGRDRLMVQLLLEAGTKHGADVDGIAYLPYFDDGTTLTALLLAIETGEMAMVQLLLDYGADVNRPAKGSSKRTPLQKAAEIGSWSIVHLLISNNADVNATPASQAGATALQLAAIGGYTGIAELLIGHDADILAPGAKSHGRTALEGAAEHGRFDMVQFLLRQVRHLDSQYTSAIDLATENGHRAVANMLRGLLMEQQASTHHIQNIQSHTCGKCGKFFTRESTLKRHIATVHSGVQQEQKFKCNICSLTFRRKDTLKRHCETHTEAAHVACPKCSRVFSRSDYLAVHLKKCQQSESAT